MAAELRETNLEVGSHLTTVVCDLRDVGVLPDA